MSPRISITVKPSFNWTNFLRRTDCPRWARLGTRSPTVSPVNLPGSLGVSICLAFSTPFNSSDFIPGARVTRVAGLACVDKLELAQHIALTTITSNFEVRN